MKNDRIKANLDASLKDVHVSHALHDEIMHRATMPEPIRRVRLPRKLVVAVAVILMLLVTTAAAITILELVRNDMQPVREFLIELIGHDDWLLEDKLYYVNLMEKWGFDLNQDKLAKLRSGEGTEDEQEQLAGEIIWDCIAAHRLTVYDEVIPDPANQPEPCPIPGTKWLFEMLWLQYDPEAELEEIHAAHDKWHMELYAALPEDTPVPEVTTEEQKYAALLKRAENYMSEVMSMSRKEREAAVVTAELNAAGTAWQVVISVKGNDLREVTREWLQTQYLYGDAQYDAETDTYSFPYVFGVGGNVGGAATLDEYDWLVLVPSSAYPAMPDKYADYPYFDPLKCFLYASAAQKAEFSQKWKPVVDAWLQEHPDYRTKLKEEGGSDPLYRITRHHYGTPPREYIQEDEALRIAILHALTLRPDVTHQQLKERCHHILYYDVCTPGRPLWKIVLLSDEQAAVQEPMVEFLVIIDPKTGEVIADQRTLPRGASADW